MVVEKGLGLTQRKFSAGLILFIVLSGSLFITLSTVNKDYLKLDLSPNDYFKANDIKKTNIYQRWYRRVFCWHHDGFFNTFGLCFKVPPSSSKDQLVRRQSGYAIPLYILQKPFLILSGKVNNFVYRLYSQLWVFAGAFFLGLLGFRIASRHGIDHNSACILAVGAALVYQNFFYNLYSISEAGFFKEMFIASLIALLLIEEISLDTMEKSYFGINRKKILNVIQFGLVFWVGYACFFGTFLVAAWGLLALTKFNPVFRLKHYLIHFVLPLALSYAVLIFQHLAGKIWLGHRGISGSSFAFRSGLDGDLGDYRDIMDIVVGKRNLFYWYGFLLLAIAALVILVFYFLKKDSAKLFLPDLTYVLLLLLFMVLYFMVFSQSVIVHPHLHMPILFLWAVLLGLLLLPVVLEKMSGHSKIFIILSFIASWIIIWINLRAYAVFAKPHLLKVIDQVEKLKTAGLW
jgi:hypothetical protein